MRWIHYYLILQMRKLEIQDLKSSVQVYLTHEQQREDLHPTLWDLTTPFLPLQGSALLFPEEDS